MRTEQIFSGNQILFSILSCALCLCLNIPQARSQDEMSKINRQMPPPLELDENRIAANGIEIIESRHLRLITDIRDRDRIREMITVFNSAVAQWCTRFEIEPGRAAVWKINCVVMQTPESLDRFRAARLLPDHVPPFPAGYSRGHEIWMYEQRGDYYTRHLLLHEGTHAFMQWFLRGSGPPWYSEGMAELLAIHRWEDGKLTIGLKDCTRDGTRYWGRPGVIQQAIRNGNGRTLREVMDFPNRAFLNVDYYGWAWAACRFLDQHPIAQSRFRSMIKSANKVDRSFNVTLRRKLKRYWNQLELEWELYTREMEYSYSVESAAFQSIEPDSDGVFAVSSEAGWQRTGIQVKPGETLQILAEGKYLIKQDGAEKWPSEAEGVSIKYYRGRRLGSLEAIILPEGALQLPEPFHVGSKCNKQIEEAGELLFRIHDHPAQRTDNSGVAQVKVIR